MRHHRSSPASRRGRRVQMKLRATDCTAIELVKARHGLSSNAEAVRVSLRLQDARERRGDCEDADLERLARTVRIRGGGQKGMPKTTRWSQWLFRNDDDLIRAMMDRHDLTSMAEAVRYALAAEARYGGDR